jgi:hypothetical protein
MTAATQTHEAEPMVNTPSATSSHKRAPPLVPTCLVPRPSALSPDDDDTAATVLVDVRLDDATEVRRRPRPAHPRATSLTRR